MSTVHFLLKTNRFNVSKVAAHFINPGCFGEDFASWFRDQLAKQEIATGQPYQEDWGWEFKVTLEAVTYYLGFGGTAFEEPPQNNRAEWRVFIEKKRTIWQIVIGSGKLAENDPMILTVEKILRNQSDFEEISRET
jgi:hypothetical protein